jgi:hypothetical protein
MSRFSQGRDAKRVVLNMEQERASISTHAIMDKVREMGLYPVVLSEGRFTSSKRLAHAMEIAYKALCAAETHLPEPTRPAQGMTSVTISSTSQ